MQIKVSHKYHYYILKEAIVFANFFPTPKSNLAIKLINHKQPYK